MFSLAGSPHCLAVVSFYVFVGFFVDEVLWFFLACSCLCRLDLPVTSVAFVRFVAFIALGWRFALTRWPHLPGRFHLPKLLARGLTRFATLGRMGGHFTKKVGYAATKPGQNAI